MVTCSVYSGDISWARLTAGQ